MGTYYVEAGTNQRPSKVVYDHEHTAIALAKCGDVNWSQTLERASWFHLTGITPAISASAADLALEAVRKAKDMGVTVILTTAKTYSSGESRQRKSRPNW